MLNKRVQLKMLVAVFMVVVVAVGMMPVNAMAGVVPSAQGVKMSPIGHPTWSPADFHIFSAPIGTAESGYAEFTETMLAILPPPNHVARYSTV